MSTIYVVTSAVQQTPSHYNDEGYTSYTYGGNVVGAYKTRERAEEVAKNSIGYRDLAGMSSYQFYDEYDNRNGVFHEHDQHTMEVLLDAFGEEAFQQKYHSVKRTREYLLEHHEDELSDFTFPKEMTKEQLDKILPVLNVSFGKCVVTEMELED